MTFFNRAMLALCFALLVLVGSTAVATAALVQHNPWEGRFTTITHNSDGSWTASVVLHGSGQLLTKQFRECRSDHMCRDQIQGGAQASSQPQTTARSGTTTRYAVFHPQYYTRYVPAGTGNIWNLDSQPQMSEICTQAGSYCVRVTADNWKAAVQIAKQQTHWPL